MERPDPQTIPASPGVYIYKDAAGAVLYVGKARMLRRRVLSYFRPDMIAVKTTAMLSHAASLQYLVTATEKEAFLLEATLIKKYRPHYNILLRDDKQYALFRLDTRAEFPRLELVRHHRKDGAQYFGPFTSALAARQTWKLLHRAFPLRRCTDRAMRNRVRPCLYHHMGQCLAPCAGLASALEYREHVEHVCLVLSGRAEGFLADLKSRMLAASEALEFERAAVLRDQMRVVEQTVERQSVVLLQGGDMDVIGLSAAEGGLGLGMLFVRGGAVLDGRAFLWPGLDFEDAPELLFSFLSQFYLDALPPPRILLPWIPADREAEEGESGAVQGAGEREVLEQFLSERRGGAVRLAAPRTPADSRLVDIAGSNAREEAARRARAVKSGPLEAVARLLCLPGPPARIECVDVSHTGGRQTRVGMVVYTDGQADRKEWRTYNMPDSGDDFATLFAWVARRLESGPPWPDLLLIDGGRGQVSTVARALREAGKEGLFPIAGIAKARDEQGHADRRAGNVADRIFVPGRSNPLPFREGSPELLFLQNVRDSTHHFAITRHRRARGREALAGELTRLPGIGPATARLLWDRFGSFQAMREAGAEEIASIKGLGKARAAKLHACLQALGGTAQNREKISGSRARKERPEKGKGL